MFQSLQDSRDIIDEEEEKKNNTRARGGDEGCEMLSSARGKGMVFMNSLGAVGTCTRLFQLTFQSG